MSWMLQPRNWVQARGRNLYNVAYRRTGTYKGMGQSGGTNIMDVNMTSTYQDASGNTFGVDSQGNVWSYTTGQMLGPAPTAGNTNIQTTFQGPGGKTYGIDMIGQVFDMASGALAAPATPGGKPAQPNWTPYLILGGGILLVMLIARR